jgi:tyrosine-protein kinase Etk/Wzc
MDLRKIWTIIWRKKWIIIQAFLLISVSATVGSLLITPIFEASAKVLIKSSDTAATLLSSIGLEDFTQMIPGMDTDSETYIAMASLEPVLRPIIEKLQLRDSDLDLLEPSKLQRSGIFLSNLSPDPRVEINELEDTDLFEIKALSSDPAEAAMIANTLAEAYIEENLKQRKLEYHSARNFIEDQIKKAKSDYLYGLEEIKSFKVKEKTIDLERETIVAINKIAELMQQKEDNIIDISETTARIRTLKAQLNRQNETIVSGSTIKQHPQIEKLRKTLSDLEVTLAGILSAKEPGQVVTDADTDLVSGSVFSETPQIDTLKKVISNLETELSGMLTEKRLDHPDVIILKQKIKNTKAELEKEIESYRTAVQQKIAKVKIELKNEIKTFKMSSDDLERLERELAALKAHLTGVNADIDNYVALLYTIPEKTFVQSQLQLNLSVSQKLYSSLLEYLYQVGIAESMTLSEIRLVETALEPDVDEPKSPNLALNITIGCILGLIFGFGLAFLTDYLDDTIKTPDDAKELGLTLLGTVPRFRRGVGPMISGLDPKDPIAESYRTIRNSIRFASLDKPFKSLLITSSMEDEGKTTTVMNLGISFAQGGKRVIVLDLDLRKPKIHELFGMSNSIGITSILLDQIDPLSVIQQTDIEGLNLITSGPLPPNPGIMVESEKMRQLFKVLSRQFDLMIIDSPPALVATDAVVISSYVDGSVLVLECGKLTRRIFSQLHDRLKQANVNLIGAILNKFVLRQGGYYYYYDKRGYYGARRK